MLNIILICIAAASLAAVYLIYRKTDKILKSIDGMIEDAANGSFTENSFTEKKLSKVEAKMYRYLSVGNTSIRQLNTEKDQIKTLIADISHQTKTPLSNIVIYTQLLSEQPGLDSRTTALVAQLENQTEKLRFLIASLVKTSRLENGIVAVRPKENRIDSLLESLDFRNAADQKGVYLEIAPAPNLHAVFDLKWTLEALSNIVDNAIKYTPAGGSVSVRAMEYELFVRVDVADTGIGMSEEETAKVFQRFYRSPRVSDEKGVGIGLYLAREILSKEGGYIKVESKPGGGSVFSAFLPKQNANLSKL